MDFRVRIILLFLALSCPVNAVNSVEEIPPPLQERSTTKLQTPSTEKKTATSTPTSPTDLLTENNSTAAHKSVTVTVVERNANYTNVVSKTTEDKQSTLKTSKISANATAPNAAAPEFEDRNEQDEGGKGEEDPDAHVDEGANAAPPADDVAAGEGVAKEDTEPAKGKEKEENQLGAMVEDAKGNVPAPPPNKIQTRIDFEQSEDSHFMTFFVVGGILVFCLYLLHHNKKKILGLMFEGRSSGHSRRNVRYRRLSQRDEHDSFKEDVIY
ncbi:hypothetical protein ANCCAN_16960 [Ancylostoma caninum]|nr:hypothetical protein ANCCAN_16960 [Ancylostoma caninum]